MEKEILEKIGSRIQCKAIEFSSPVTGTIKFIYNNTVVIFVEQVQPIDKAIAIEKNYIAMALIKEIVFI